MQCKFCYRGLYSFIMSLLGLMLHGQVVNSGVADTISGNKLGNISIGGYIDAYYSYHFNRPENGEVPYFVSMNRHNEVNINLAMLDMRYSNDRLRARLAPGFGTYMNANYAAESGGMKFLVEANAGVKIFKNKDIWIDFGILGSPFTNESCLSRDHLMYTRSLAPEYVPYYLSGAKVSIPLNRRFNFYLYLINGWQQIADQNKAKSLATQIEFRPNDKNLLNWDFYAGDERSLEFPENRMRYFSDFYWIHNPDGKLSITSCVYFGAQYRSLSSNKLDVHYWWQLNLICRYRISKKTSISGRMEYFNDKNTVQIRNIISPEAGFRAAGGGICLNQSLFNNGLLRWEWRYLYATEEAFKTSNGTAKRLSTWLTGNLTVWF